MKFVEKAKFYKFNCKAIKSIRSEKTYDAQLLATASIINYCKFLNRTYGICHMHGMEKSIKIFLNKYLHNLDNKYENFMKFRILCRSKSIFQIGKKIQMFAK